MSETNSNASNGAGSGAENGAGGAGADLPGAAAATLSTAAAPIVPLGKASKNSKSGKAASTGALVAVGRVFYRDPDSKSAEIRNGKFFADGEELTGVDAAHLADMEESGQAKLPKAD